uniref:Uncharacterized protein n=1 Tax=Periophthalmus magnuspinnatus TaxID=409849 RepID=A0A3B4B346_9GOBI
MASTYSRWTIFTDLSIGDADKSFVHEFVWAYLDPGTPALAHSVGHSGSGRVDHGHEADEAQVLRGEVHLICVESKALWELLVGQVVMAETWVRKRGK